jgi:hypothetical protein
MVGPSAGPNRSRMTRLGHYLRHCVGRIQRANNAERQCRRHGGGERSLQAARANRNVLMINRAEFRNPLDPRGAILVAQIQWAQDRGQQVTQFGARGVIRKTARPQNGQQNLGWTSRRHDESGRWLIIWQFGSQKNPRLPAERGAGHRSDTRFARAGLVNLYTPSSVHNWTAFAFNIGRALCPR